MSLPPRLPLHWPASRRAQRRYCSRLPVAQGATTTQAASGLTDLRIEPRLQTTLDMRARAAVPSLRVSTSRLGVAPTLQPTETRATAQRNLPSARSPTDVRRWN